MTAPYIKPPAKAPLWKPTDLQSPLSSHERIELARLAGEGSRNLSGEPDPPLFSLRDRGFVSLHLLSSGWSEVATTIATRCWYLGITDAGRAALRERSDEDERAAIVAEFMYEEA